MCNTKQRKNIQPSALGDIQQQAGEGRLGRETKRATGDADVETQIAAQSIQRVCYPAFWCVIASFVLDGRDADMEV